MEAKEGKSVFQLYYDDMEHARQAGIEEVVKWVDKNATDIHSNGKMQTFYSKEWQSQKKKWGVE